MRFTNTVFLLLVVFAWVVPCSAKAIKVEDPVFGFAEYLFGSQDYFRAIGEYRRFIYASPGSPKVPEAEYKVGICFLRGKRFEEALGSFQKLAASVPSGVWAEKACSKLGDVPYFNKEYSAAITRWKDYTKKYPNSTLVPRVQYLSGWAEAYQHHFGESSGYFISVTRSATTPSDLRIDTERILVKLQGASNLPSRSPLLAGVLSALLPGGGQFYCDRYADAGMALLANGVFGYLAYDAFRRQDSGASIVWGTVAFLFYSGNIYGGFNSAKHFDRNAKGSFVSELEKYKLFGVEEAF